MIEDDVAPDQDAPPAEGEAPAAQTELPQEAAPQAAPPADEVPEENQPSGSFPPEAPQDDEEEGDPTPLADRTFRVRVRADSEPVFYQDGRLYGPLDDLVIYGKDWLPLTFELLPPNAKLEAELQELHDRLNPPPARAVSAAALKREMTKTKRRLAELEAMVGIKKIERARRKAKQGL